MRAHLLLLSPLEKSLETRLSQISLLSEKMVTITRTQTLKELKSALKDAKKKSLAAKAAISQLKEHFKDVTTVFTHDELADIGEEF
ncbi:hypothetical protein RHMOL_Rhmol11G0185200 [Rhododendron molle]|uniref:Uncharacterized protein n=1 Tax=Rhododendron molle TaxID=49168 RepID=A0ACC0LTN2_RHOML|nr:hypothetical protein RHMOL_Rhmol11G0185200 [Rhododendron molle]